MDYIFPKRLWFFFLCTTYKTNYVRIAISLNCIDWILFYYVWIREGTIFNSRFCPHSISALRLSEMRALSPSLGLGQTVMCCSTLIPIYSFSITKISYKTQKESSMNGKPTWNSVFMCDCEKAIILYHLLSKIVSVSVCDFTTIKTA